MADDTDDRRYPALGPARRAQALLVAVAFFTAMDIYVVSLLVEPIKHDLGLSDVQVGLANTTVLYAAYALFCVPMGMLADRISRVRMLVAAMLLWCIGLAVTGLSHSLGLLMASKAILGIANAVTLPASLSLLADYFAPRHRAMATSSYAIGQGAGPRRRDHRWRAGAWCPHHHRCHRAGTTVRVERLAGVVAGVRRVRTDPGAAARHAA